MDQAPDQTLLLEEIRQRLERLENQHRELAVEKIDIGQFAIDLRRARIDVFPDEYCTGNIWDVLLELYDAKRSGEKLRLLEISAKAKIPEKLTLRYIDLLSADGFLYHEESLADRGQPHILLTDKAMIQIDLLLKQIQIKFSGRQEMPDIADNRLSIATNKSANVV